MRLSYLSLGAVALSIVACEPGARVTPDWMQFNWPAADSLFQRDRSWVGGDGAYSIDLGDGRVLWLFGDSWIDPSGRGERRRATMVSNSLAVQHGYDPSRARAEFFWRTDSTGVPQAFFADSAGVRYWPGHGTMLGGRLLLFLMVVESSQSGIGFEVTDWDVVLVLNPEVDPDDWNIRTLDSPANGRQVIVGSGGVLSHEGYVYAFSAQEPSAPHDIYLVRWTVQAVLAETLSEMQWWHGPQAGWGEGSSAWRDAVPVFGQGQSELTVHYDSVAGEFVEIQTTGFGPASITRRTALTPMGPWDEATVLFTPPQTSFPNILIYQGKAHPELTGAGLVVTYSTNSLRLEDHQTHGWLYYPRFVKLN